MLKTTGQDTAALGPLRWTRHNTVTTGLLLALALLPPVALAVDNPFWITMVTRALIYALAAMALDLVMGYGRMVSFGHAAFLGLGAYTVGILARHAFEGTPLLLGWSGSNEALLVWPLAMLIAAGFGLVVGLISLRTTGVYFIMITLAMGQMVYYFFISLSAYGGEDGLPIWGRNTLFGYELSGRAGFYYLCLAILVTAWALLHRVVASRFGRVIEGCRQDERRMRALGFKPYPYKLAAFCLSGALVGLAGALLANHNEFVSPTLVHWSSSGQLMIIVLLGGIATLIGPIWGALALLLMEETLVSFTEHWQIILGPVLVLAVLFFKGGVIGALRGRPGTHV